MQLHIAQPYKINQPFTILLEHVQWQGYYDVNIFNVKQTTHKIFIYRNWCLTHRASPNSNIVPQISRLHFNKSICITIVQVTKKMAGIEVQGEITKTHLALGNPHHRKEDA